MTPFKNPYKLPTPVNSLFVNLLEDTINSLFNQFFSCHTVKKPTKTNKQATTATKTQNNQNSKTTKMLKWILSVFISGLYMLNGIMTNYYFTFRVIRGKTNRVGFDIFLSGNILSQTNLITVSLYHILWTTNSKQDASYSSQNQTVIVLWSQFNCRWIMSPVNKFFLQVTDFIGGSFQIAC